MNENVVETFSYGGTTVTVKSVGPVGLQQQPSFIASLDGEPFSGLTVRRNRGHRWYKSVKGVKRAARQYIRELQHVESPK